MKNNNLIISVTVFLLSLVAFGQQDTIWLDAKWKKTDRKDASYYRTKVKKNKGYLIVDHYLNGMKQMEGLSLDKDIEMFDGPVKWYFENGKLRMSANYRNGLLEGKYEVFLKDGTLVSLEFYKKNKREGPYKTFYNDGTSKESGSYKDDLRNGFWKLYYANGKLKEEGYYKDDKRVKTWKVYYYNGENQDQKYF